MSSALSLTCIFYVFYFISTIGHIGQAHHALSWCMLYFTDRGMCNLDIDIVHHLYWSTQFLFSSLVISTFGYLSFIWFDVNTPIQCLLILLYFYFAHLPKLYYVSCHHMLPLISGSSCFCLTFIIL